MFLILLHEVGKHLKNYYFPIDGGLGSKREMELDIWVSAPGDISRWFMVGV